jgi:hypothetical protein
MPIPWNDAEEYSKYVCCANLISADCRLQLSEEDYFMSRSNLSDQRLQNRRSILSAWKNRAPSFESICSNCSYSATFDDIMDSTWVDMSLREVSLASGTSAISFSSFIPPPAGFGCGSLRFINKLIDNKLLGFTGGRATGLTGPSSLNGFVLCYELLTNNLNLKILKDDNSQNLGCFLVRMLPRSEITNKGFLCSVLRSVVLNPDIADVLPGYYNELLKAKTEAEREVKQSGILAQMADRMLGALDTVRFNAHFLESVIEKLVEANFAPREAGSQSLGALRWPKVKDNYRPPNTIFLVCDELKVLDGKAFRLYHGFSDWTGLEVSSSERTFTPVRVESLQGGGVLAFDRAAVLSLTGLLMEPISVGNYVNFVEPNNLKQGQEKQNSDDFSPEHMFQQKFRLHESPIVRTRNARETISRLSLDLQLFLGMEKQTMVPELKGFSAKDIQVIAEDTGELSNRIEQLDKLISSLSNLHLKETEFTQGCFDEALLILCKVKEQDLHHVVFNLAHESCQAPKSSVELVTNLLLDKKADLRLQEINPFLTQSMIKKFENLLVGSLLSFNRLGLIARCLAIGNELLDLLRDFRSSPDRPSVNAVVLKSNALAELLCTKRGYTELLKEKADAVSYDPRFLLFEFTSNIILRDAQIRLVRRFIDCFKRGESLCHQLIMGAGKTTVIAPLLALILGSPSRLVVQVGFSL